MYSDLSAYPRIADADYSPTDDHLPRQSLDQIYLINPYTTSPDQFFRTSLDDLYFERLKQSVDLSQSWNYGPAYCPTEPFGASNPNYTLIVDDIPMIDMDMPTTPETTYSSTSNRGNDSIPALASPQLSPSSIKHDNPGCTSSPTEDSAPKPPKRKRGRPRLKRNLITTTTTTDPSTTAPPSKHRQRPPCQPHKQIERKYREGLNSDLEKLRRAVPTLAQSDEGTVIGQAKLSKAMVLSCAVQYIKEIEMERDRLKVGNERLRGGGVCGEGWG